MDWQTVFGLIDTQLLVVVAACWCLGYVLKRTPKVPDWTIVYIVTLAAIVVVIGLHGVSVQSIIQGVLCGAFAVYGHQVVKQAKEKE